MTEIIVCLRHILRDFYFLCSGYQSVQKVNPMIIWGGNLVTGNTVQEEEGWLGSRLLIQCNWRAARAKYDPISFYYLTERVYRPQMSLDQNPINQKADQDMRADKFSSLTSGSLVISSPEHHCQQNTLLSNEWLHLKLQKGFCFSLMVCLMLLAIGFS